MMPSSFLKEAAEDGEVYFPNVPEHLWARRTGGNHNTQVIFARMHKPHPYARTILP